jgi:hypothetical protein
LAFFPSFIAADMAHANNAVCDTHQVNGGDEAFLMNLNTPLEFGGTVYNGNVYVSPKGTVTFGQGDYTFWDYPATPSISIGSYDYHAFAGSDNDLYVRYGSTETSICVDWKVLLWGQFSGEPIYIRMIAQVNPVNYTWTPTYQVSSNAPANARYGLRYVQGGPIVPLTIQTITTPPVQDPVVLPPAIPPQTPQGASVIQEGSVFEFTAPEGKKVASVNGYYGDPADGTKGSDVSLTLSELFSGKTSGTIQVSNDSFGSDPAPGTNKVLIVLINYEDIPIDTTPVNPEPTPEPSLTPTPVEPEPTPTPEPSPVVPVVPEPQPSIPVTPEPEPSQEPSPEPTIPPQPEETEQPEEPATEPEEPVEELSPIEPEPIEPPVIEPTEESITSAEELPEEISPEVLMAIDFDEIVPTELSEAQAEALIEAALETFETAEQGSEEYIQALEALFVAAQQDDIVLDEALAAIPLLGDVLGEATELINFLGNAGADMSPQVREDSEKVVVTAVVAVQAALSAVSISGIATTVNIRSGA